MKFLEEQKMREEEAQRLKQLEKEKDKEGIKKKIFLEDKDNDIVNIEEENN